MDMLDDSVGAYGFFFISPLPSEMGEAVNRGTFSMKAGDNPDFWMAQRLMPGAVVYGKVAGIVIHGAASEDELQEAYEKHFHACELRVGRSVFRTRIYAPSPEDLLPVLRSIGGLRRAGDAPAGWLERVCLFVEYYWRRRPVVVRRNPLRP